MQKIYTISITCLTGRYLTEAFQFVLDMPADATLDELASCILDVVEFDGDHLSEFYLANSLRGKKLYFTADGAWDDDDSATLDLRLCDIYPLDRNKKMYYAYDFGASWCFEIVKKGKETPPLEGREYPYLVSQEGAKPLEYGPDD